MANWAKECRLCRYAGGRCIPGYKKVHVRTDQACRLHEATTKDNVYAKVRQQQQRDPSRSRGEATTPPPGGDGPARPNLDHMVRFVTKKGLGLLFHSGPLDKWIGREVHYEEETERFWETPGEYFNDEMTKSYTAYRGSLQKRRALGRAADKLVKITDKYLPKVTDEARVYVMRFPQESQDPNTPEASEKGAEESKRPCDKGGSKPPTEKGQTAEPMGRSEPSSRNTTSPNHPDPKESGGELKSADAATPHDPPDLPVLEEVVDWGGTSSEASDSHDDSHTPRERGSPDRHSPEKGETQPKTPSRSPTRSSSGLGGMRPRSPSRSPHRSPTRSPTRLGGMRPRTPSRSPRRNVQLVPNQHWRNVRAVQAHMARSRSTRPSRQLSPTRGEAAAK